MNRLDLLVWMAVSAFAVLMVYAFSPLASSGEMATFVPLCHEDEVVTFDGGCHPMDDSHYVSGTGWVAE